MTQIANKQILREVKSLKLVYRFEEMRFTELASKFEHDAGFDKETAEQMAAAEIRRLGK